MQAGCHNARRKQFYYFVVRSGDRMSFLIMRNFVNVICLSVVFMAGPVVADGPRLMHKGPIAIDLLGKLEWMRCSIGQFWEEEGCKGEPLKLTLSQVPEVVARFEGLDRGGWRLPTRDELESLVSENDMPPMINAETFPSTPPRAYWTSEPNFFNERNHWVVNFFTGYGYGRAFPHQPQYVRLVRNRKK
jgi:hypothetical protein